MHELGSMQESPDAHGGRAAPATQIADGLVDRRGLLEGPIRLGERSCRQCEPGGGKLRKSDGLRNTAISRDRVCHEQASMREPMSSEQYQSDAEASQTATARERIAAALSSIELDQRVEH